MICGGRWDATGNRQAAALWLAHGMEVGVYALTLWLTHAPLWAGITAVVAVALGWRTALVIITWSLARRYGGSCWQRHAPGMGATLRLLAGELLASLALYSALQPLEPWLMRPHRRDGDCGREPAVVLVHGFLCNGAVWWALRRRLRAAGLRRVHTVNLPPDYADIGGNLDRLHAALAGIREREGEGPLVIVGHSMGGLLARLLIHRAEPGERLPTRIITVGSPHRGTYHSRWLALGRRGPAPPDAAWLQSLNAAGDEAPPVPVVSIFSVHDTLVSPASSAELAHADNIELRWVGHVGLLLSRRCHAAILTAIRQVGAS